jgi:hypothetical protein
VIKGSLPNKTGEFIVTWAKYSENIDDVSLTKKGGSEGTCKIQRTQGIQSAEKSD